MKSQTLPTKRQAATKGIFRRLSAVTYGRKQRVSAATADRDMDFDDGSTKISRALTIIFLIHVVAIALIFIHHRFLDGRPIDKSLLASTQTPVADPVVATPVESPQIEHSQLTSGAKTHIVDGNETYAQVAARFDVAEKDLRLFNQNAVLCDGFILKIPVKTVVVKANAPTGDSAAVVATPTADDGLVEAVDTSHAPRAHQVAATTGGATTPTTGGATTTGGSKEYVVQTGDSFWRIANQLKVDQNALMKANGISDARKLRVGMKLKIP